MFWFCSGRILLIASAYYKNLDSRVLICEDIIVKQLTPESEHENESFRGNSIIISDCRVSSFLKTLPGCWVSRHKFCFYWCSVKRFFPSICFSVPLKANLHFDIYSLSKCCCFVRKMKRNWLHN